MPLVIDDLKYDYKDNGHSNILLKVSDGPNGNPAVGFIDGFNTNNDYEYDTFGNMLSDQNKGITSIEYNHLNLPRRINFATGGNIIYIYNAQGVKLQKTVTYPNNTQSITRYRGGFQYDNTTLQFVHNSEGYVRHTPSITSVGTHGDFDYVFNYTDHLGNIRLSYVLDPSGEGLKVMEENHYYPFGLKHTYNLDKRSIGYFENLDGGTFDPTQDTRRTRMVNNNGYQYKFQGQEWQDELGLAMYDYGARNYDPTTGRWNGIDLLSEKYHPLSPYSFVANDPVKYKDAEGMDIVDKRGGSNQLIIIDENGQLQWTEHSSSKRNSGAVQVLKEMLKTDKGKQIVMNLVKSKTKTNINLVETSTYQSDFYIDENKKLKIALGYTDYTNSEILVDENGMPYFNNATINIYRSSFKIMNGDKSSLPNWAKNHELGKNVDMEPYEDFGKFLNGIGTHEGSHILNDLLESMNDLGIDKITVNGNDAKKVFKSLISSYLKLNSSKDAPLEEVPLENEKETNKQY
jgi:RHS repeat-associated protein